MTTINPSRPAVSPTARPAPAQTGPGSGIAPAIDPLKLVQKYKWLLGVTAALGVLLGTAGHFALLYTYPIYSTTVIFECFPVETDPEHMGLITHKDDLEKFQATQVQVLLSDLTIDKTINDPRLQTEAPTWTSQFMRGAEFDRRRAATKMRRNMSAGIIGESNLVRLTFWWTDPDEAAAIARIIGRVYLDGRQQVAQSDISDRKQVILRQVSIVDEEARALQRTRDRILQDRSIDALDAAVNSASRQLELADTKLSALSMQREEWQVHLAQLENELATPAGINFSDTIRQRVDNHPEISSQKHTINRLEAALQAQSVRGIGATHRSRIHLESELESARQILAERRQRLLRQTFDAELDTIRTTIRSMQAQELEQRNLREQANQRAIEFTQIKQTVIDLDNQITRLNETKARFNESLKKIEVTTAGRSQSRVTLYQNAQRPRQVSFPKLYLMVPAGLFLLLGLVGGLVLLVEVIDQRVKSPADVAMIPRTRVLGLIAHVSEDPAAPPRVETVFRDQPGGVLAEHFRQLRGAVLKRMQQGGHKSLVVMSGMPESGATTVVLNLALSMAAAEQRILVIDANFRRPALHRHLGLAEAPGLADVLAGSRSLADCTQTTEDARMHVLSAGSPDNRMFERLGTEAMGELLRETSSQYDIVLIDVAPAMVAGDAISVANRADASLLVVRAMGEKRGMVARLRNELSDARGEFLGVLVNAARSAAGGYLRGNILATHTYRTPQGK